MRLLGWIGILVILAGIDIVAVGGIPYTKSRNEVEVGPIVVRSQERGMVPAYVGVIAIVVGAGLVIVGRKKSA